MRAGVVDYVVVVDVKRRALGRIKVGNLGTRNVDTADIGATLERRRDDRVERRRGRLVRI